MKVIQKRILHKSRSDSFRIIPLGDVHLGARGCDEERLIDTVKYIKDNNYYWIGMGDYCDFINRRDPRFSLASQAEWLWGEVDMVAIQKKRFVEIVSPIATQCLALLEGNHETAILRHTERNIYSEIVADLKEIAKMPEEQTLGIGYSGWLQLLFSREIGNGKDTLNPTKIITINLHHGFVGGKLAGAKALNMQRWLWTHDCDIAIFGHSHNTSIQIEAIERINRAGQLVKHNRKGCYAGTFLHSSGDGYTTYSEVKGYFPLPMDGVEIELIPFHPRQPIKIYG